MQQKSDFKGRYLGLKKALNLPLDIYATKLSLALSSSMQNNIL